MRTLQIWLMILFSSLVFCLPAAAQQNGTIVIEATPPDALIRIMNISPPYESGMQLEPGTYDVEVSKEGYITQRRDVTVKGGTQNRFSFDLKEAPPEGALFVQTQPADATVRVMNIAPAYEDGISVPAGDYDLEISKSGFATITKTVTVKANQENRFSFTLTAEAAANNASQTATPAQPEQKSEPVVEQKPEPVAKNGTLTVVTEPKDAEIHIMNIKPAYEAGMSVSAGDYDLKISKPGYVTLTHTVTVKAGQDNSFSFTLAAEPAKDAQAVTEAEQKPGPGTTNGTLTVQTDPKNATVRILNIKPPYKDGIELEPGEYAIEVSHPGYMTRSMDYQVEAGSENTLTVKLAPEETAAEQTPVKKTPAIASVVQLEEFSNNDRKWFEASTPQVNIAVQDGHYHIDHKAGSEGWIAWNTMDFDPKSQFVIEAVFRKVDGVLDYGYGVIWGVTNKGEAYNSFRISGNGLYSYRQEKDGKADTVIDWTPSDAIAPGLGATNTIHIRRNGDTLEFYVNGVKVNTAPYKPAGGTMVGFKVDNRQVVDVDQLMVGLAK